MSYSDEVARKYVAELQARLLSQEKEIQELRRALNQHGHTVTFDDDGWFTEHPVACRSIPGMNCAINEALRELPLPPFGPGTFPVDVDDEGELVFDLSGIDESKLDWTNSHPRSHS